MRKLFVLFTLFFVLGSIPLVFAEDVPVCSQCGGTGTVEVEYEDTCTSCNGNGYAACESCGGSGQTDEAWYPECEACRGSGKRDGQPCIGCGGSGHGRENFGCRDCGGTGLSRVVCPECEGYGTVLTIEDEPCPACASES